MIDLKKKGSTTSIDLRKGGSFPTTELVVNLNWSEYPAGKPKPGFFGRLFGAGGIDLDLGCFYELTDGSKSVIDGLQFSDKGGPRNRVTKQGCYTQAPWIWHTGDDLTGGSDSGEFIHVNPSGFSDIKRIHIYAYIYDGVVNWADCDATVKITVPGQEEILVKLGELSAKESFVVLCSMDFSDGSILVSNKSTFHNGHGEADKAHRWGMRWVAGSK